MDIIPDLLDSGIFTAAKILKKKPKARKAMLISSLIIIFITGIGLILNYVFFNSSENIILILSVPLVFFTILLLICILSYFEMSENSLDRYLEFLANERIELNKKLDTKNELENNVMDVIKINLNQLNEYYTINKAQARRSYSFSIVMITLGFLILILAIVLLLFGKIGINITIICTLSGLIAEFIGATSLVLYKESTKQIQLFFEKLSYLQHIMLAVELSDKLSDSRKESEVSTIISSLISKK